MADSLANRMSAFNFCSPFDCVLPASDGAIKQANWWHLWGMYVGLLPAEQGTRRQRQIKSLVRARRQRRGRSR